MIDLMTKSDTFGTGGFENIKRSKSPIGNAKFGKFMKKGSY